MIIRPPPRFTNRTAYLKYIEVDLWSWMKQLCVAFSKINFQDNFQSFTVENLLIPAGEEVPIYNGFQGRYPGVIPTARLIVRQIGNANIIDGNTAWTAQSVYLLNPSINDATVTVIFFI